MGAQMADFMCVDKADEDTEDALIEWTKYTMCRIGSRINPICSCLKLKWPPNFDDAETVSHDDACSSQVRRYSKVSYCCVGSVQRESAKSQVHRLATIA